MWYGKIYGMQLLVNESLWNLSFFYLEGRSRCEDFAEEGLRDFCITNYLVKTNSVV